MGLKFAGGEEPGRVLKSDKNGIEIDKTRVQSRGGPG